MSLDGKRVIVIGGATGIGFAISELAFENGAAVVIASSNKTNVDAAVERLPGAMGRTADLRDETQVAEFFEELGSFDHLAVTAGDWSVPMFGPTQDIEMIQAKEVFAVRFWGALAAVKHGCRRISHNGSVTLTSGMITHRPRKGTPVAAAMGGAVEHLTRGLAIDLAPVRVNAVCPGIILTDTSKQMPEAMLRAMVDPLPIPRGAQPAEAARAYVYLMLNDYVTGQILPIDGGGLLV